VRPDRTRRVLEAIGKRISRQGDMEIRVSRATMRVLMRALGLQGWEPGCDEFREVDALALDMLRHLAWQRLP
jgi:tRNA threonylcarbamoyladenosine modification (KEOPS) complex Cgi121 subunit